MSDFPFDDCVKTADVQIAVGNEIHQKFTCANCGSRQTMEQKNTFFESGTCEECGHVTDIRAKGCNYVLIIPGRKQGGEQIRGH